MESITPFFRGGLRLICILFRDGNLSVASVEVIGVKTAAYFKKWI